MREAISQLSSEIHELHERLRRLEDRPADSSLRRVFLARKEGAASGGSQPVIFLNGDETDRQDVANTTTAIVVTDPNLLVFEQGGVFFAVEVSGAPALLQRATADGTILDGQEGDITVVGATGNPKTGVWDHGTGGLDLNTNAELWVQLRSDGKYDIVEVGCDGAS